MRCPARGLQPLAQAARVTRVCPALLTAPCHRGEGCPRRACPQLRRRPAGPLARWRGCGARPFGREAGGPPVGAGGFGGGDMTTGSSLRTLARLCAVTPMRRPHGGPLAFSTDCLPQPPSPVHQSPRAPCDIRHCAAARATRLPPVSGCMARAPVHRPPAASPAGPRLCSRRTPHRQHAPCACTASHAGASLPRRHAVPSRRAPAHQQPSVPESPRAKPFHREACLAAALASSVRNGVAMARASPPLPSPSLPLPPPRRRWFIRGAPARAARGPRLGVRWPRRAPRPAKGPPRRTRLAHPQAVEDGRRHGRLQMQACYSWSQAGRAWLARLCVHQGGGGHRRFGFPLVGDGCTAVAPAHALRLHAAVAPPSLLVRYPPISCGRQPTTVARRALCSPSSACGVRARVCGTGKTRGIAIAKGLPSAHCLGRRRPGSRPRGRSARPPARPPAPCQP